MARLSVIVLCCLQLSSVLAGRAQSATTGQETPDGRNVRLQHIAEPPELAGEPGPIPTHRPRILAVRAEQSNKRRQPS